MNIKKVLFLLGFLLFMTSCKEKKIFEITNPEELFTLTNHSKGTILEKKAKSLLTFNEIVNTSHNYKKLNTVYENEHFKALIILSEPKTKTDLHILLRTIRKKDNTIIDTFLLSSYNKKTKEFCSGFISKNLKLTRICESVNFRITKQIDTFGKILTAKN